MEVGQGEGGSAGGKERGRAGVDGIVIRLGARNHARRDRGRHQEGGVHGSQRLQWSGVERSGVEWSGAEDWPNGLEKESMIK